MPDGSAPLGEFFHVRQAGAFRPLPRGIDAAAWYAAHRHLLDAPPVEIDDLFCGTVAVFDPAPSANPDHVPRPGVGVEHVLSEYTLKAAGIYRPEVEYPTLSAEDGAIVTVKDPAEQQRAKERRRKRERSRIIRDGAAPQVDPIAYKPEQRWAVEAVNLIARKRYSPPEGRLTTWLTDFEPEQRATACWIFRHVARRGGGHGPKKKYSARTIISALLAPVFPANMRIDGVAPTPSIEGRVLAPLPNAHPKDESHHDHLTRPTAGPSPVSPGQPGNH